MYFSKYLLFVILVVSSVSCRENNGAKGKSPEVEQTEITKLPYFNSAYFTPEWEKATHKIPTFSFVNQIGDTITNKTYEGNIYVADFFFTVCPGICPQLTKNMGVLQEEYRDDPQVKLLSHSVMPWNDTVEKLAEYAVENNVHLPKWNLVTGDTDAMYGIARNGYFADEDFVKTQDASNFIHTENFILVDAAGYIRGVYNGTLPLEIKRLIRHIQILKKEL